MKKYEWQILLSLFLTVVQALKQLNDRKALTEAEHLALQGLSGFFADSFHAKSELDDLVQKALAGTGMTVAMTRLWESVGEWRSREQLIPIFTTIRSMIEGRISRG